MKSVVEPLKHMPIISETPEDSYKLDHVYGYRCYDALQNLHMLNKKMVYTTASLIIEQDIGNGTQKIIGGGEIVEDNAKLPDSIHTDGILCLAVSKNHKKMATSQIGRKPCIILWDTDMEIKYKTTIQISNERINVLSFSKDGKYLACNSMNGKIYLINTETGKIEDTLDGSKEKIFSISWSDKEEEYIFIAVGLMLVKFYSPFSNRKSQFALFKEFKICNFICSEYGSSPISYSAGTNGKIYMWNGNVCASAVKKHNGSIHTLLLKNNTLISGGTDNKISISNPTDLTFISSFDVSSCARSIDVEDGEMLIGLRDGNIIYVDKQNEKRIIVSSHNDGQLCGLAIDGDFIVTSGEDNLICIWNYKDARLVKQSIIDELQPPSSNSNFSAHNCSRVVCVNPTTHHIAVGINDGTVQIRESYSAIDNVLFRLKCAKNAISFLSYSPNGELLAVGSYDFSLYIFSTVKKYTLRHILSAHKSAIIGIDWSIDSAYLRTNSDSNECFYWNAVESKKEEKSEKLSNVEWKTVNCKLSWECTGIFPLGTEPAYIKAVKESSNHRLLGCGNEWGKACIYKFPSKEVTKTKMYYGHEEEVTNIGFSEDGQYFFTLGGYDHTLMQWKKV